jgi:hypothetical protein
MLALLFLDIEDPAYLGPQAAAIFSPEICCHRSVRLAAAVYLTFVNSNRESILDFL